VAVNGEVVKGLGEGGEIRRAELPTKFKARGPLSNGQCLGDEVWFLNLFGNCFTVLGSVFFLIWFMNCQRPLVLAGSERSRGLPGPVRDLLG
jgi:hypothetical protein